jgi:hypothetical protein
VSNGDGGGISGARPDGSVVTAGETGALGTAGCVECGAVPAAAIFTRAGVNIGAFSTEGGTSASHAASSCRAARRRSRSVSSSV